MCLRSAPAPPGCPAGRSCRAVRPVRRLDFRICQLQAVLDRTEDEEERCLLAERIRMLSTMFREARELAVLTERYYERGYRRNVKYTI